MRALFVLGVVAVTSFLACGGAVDQSVAGATVDAGLDAGGDASVRGFSCVLTPVEGNPCTTTASLCSWPPPPGCSGAAWACTEGVWEYEGEPICVESTGEDDGGAAGITFDAAFETKGACAACHGDMCIVTRKGSKVTARCQFKPPECTGSTPTCGCAGAWCDEGCQCAGGGASQSLECVCADP